MANDLCFENAKQALKSRGQKKRAGGLCPKNSTVQHLFHSGLEPGDRRQDEIRETVLTVSSSSGPLSFEHEQLRHCPGMRNR
jgi:hypothetical protein